VVKTSVTMASSIVGTRALNFAPSQQIAQRRETTGSNCCPGQDLVP
jgi:hypothetical protein